MNPRLQESLKLIKPEQPLGLYLHVPFCRDRCAYCSFTSSTDYSSEPVYVKRLVQDIESWGRFLDRPKLDTLYMGGGTPSTLSQHSLQTISQAIHNEFDTTELLEATLEANPGTIDENLTVAARQMGWDRISLGVQTLDDRLLQSLGRLHNAVQALDTIKMCQDAGFGRISADLLIGVPEQRLERVLEDAITLVEAGVEHLSIYMLDIDKQCPLKSMLDSGRLELPPDEVVAETWQALQKHLADIGFTPYEISNYSRTGGHSRHNVRYWQRLPYIGLGPDAASNIGNIRWTEEQDISRWINETGEPDIQFLSKEETLAEIPLLALRMNNGINWSNLRELAENQDISHLVQKWESELVYFLNNNLLKWEGENLCLTSEGMLLSNQIFQMFV